MTDEISITATHIGGINDASVTLKPGVNALVGRNATNRTSFLQAIMAACGSRDVALKSDADEGEVRMTVGEKTYTRRLTRTEQGVQFDGEPYLEDTTGSDLFAFLLGTNEARQAVLQQRNLRDILMRPVDTDEIRAEIERLREEKRRLDDRLEELDDLKDRLPGLEETRQRLQSERETKLDQLEEKRAEVEAADAGVDESREEQSELEAKLDDLSQVRSELEEVRYDLETQQERLTSLEEETADLEASLSDLPETPAGRLSEIETEIDRLRQQKQTLESDVNELRNVIQFNETRLETTGDDLTAALDGGSSTESVTDQLVAQETTVCWTCGSTVDTDQIEATIDRLRELSQRKLGDVAEIESDLEELQSERQELQNQQDRRRTLERRLDQTAEQIDETESTIADLEDRKATLKQRAEELETEVNDLESAANEEIIERQREVDQLEFEIERIETDIEETTEEIRDIEDRLDQRATLETEREELQSELTDLRTRIDTLEEQAVTAFNDHIGTVLELLDYDNIERIWLERVERQVRDGRQRVTKTAFDLHVVRSGASGSAYEDTLSNLSESEREVTGLMFALAGYLTHEIHEECPFMLLDSLEAIDTERIATLVEYFADEVPYLVVALLEEDASGLDQPHHRIESI